MSRLAHNRALLLVLVVILQVGLLPGAALGPCAMNADSWLACCCGPEVSGFEPITASSRDGGNHGCCGDELPPGDGAAELLWPPSPAGDASTCQCDSDGSGEAPATTPERERPSFDGASATDAARRSVDGLAASKRLALRASPRAATGPPIHLVHQVFTI